MKIRELSKEELIEESFVDLTYAMLEETHETKTYAELVESRNCSTYQKRK